MLYRIFYWCSLSFFCITRYQWYTTNGTSYRVISINRTQSTKHKDVGRHFFRSSYHQIQIFNDFLYIFFQEQKYGEKIERSGGGVWTVFLLSIFFIYSLFLGLKLVLHCSLFYSFLPVMFRCKDLTISPIDLILIFILSNVSIEINAQEDSFLFCER
jgi:hypothetical protein